MHVCLMVHVSAYTPYIFFRSFTEDGRYPVVGLVSKFCVTFVRFITLVYTFHGPLAISTSFESAVYWLYDLLE